MQREQEAARQARVRTGTDRVNSIFGDNFTDDTFSKVRNSYTEFAMPELDRQYGDAEKALATDLANRGLLDSSVRAEKEADLRRQKDDAVRGIGQTALEHENTARADAEAARADLIKTLNATGDVEGAVSDALARARTATSIPAFSPIGQLFTTALGAGAQQVAEERAAAASGGAYRPRFDTGLYSAANSVKVT